MYPRIAELADFENITALINLAFQVERFFIDGDRITIGAVRELAAKGQFLVMEDSNGLAGCIYVESRGERGYLGLLSVAPARQRSGLGSKLVHAAEDHCRRAGCGFVDLRIVNLRQELPAFYRRLGYCETGTTPFTPGIVAKLPCHFIEMTKALERTAGAAS